MTKVMYPIRSVHYIITELIPMIRQAKGIWNHQQVWLKKIIIKFCLLKKKLLVLGSFSFFV
jgi:hypothetical protein